ncbi:copper homeostasis membrane protein CopD [Pseudomonas oryzihabitans]|uniref:copper homeostasis membrane protein CopD n=1 Tax=Pseudomonas oryzihabitans TaxID=47885 RepID=UPI0011A84E15|nr:copper homeostasis membrane protein CopD [Pseudomonas psychrotolerans]
MTDPWSIALRGGLYAVLMALLGLALFGLYGLDRPARRSGVVLPLTPLLATCAGLALPLSALALLQLATVLSGASAWAEAWSQVPLVATQTAAGVASLVRLGALLGVLLACLAYRRSPSASLLGIAVLGATALATLAWAGHGVMDDAPRRLWHLGATLVHLWVSAGWLGALLAFAWLLFLRPPTGGSAMQPLLRALAGFATTGTLLVALAAATGLAKYLFIVGPRLAPLLEGGYGALLLGKLGLFLAMLGMAALNRWRLTPALAATLDGQAPARAVRRLRLSIGLELAAALGILALVAWLGTLDPDSQP